MKLVMVADTHEKHLALAEMPEGDVFIHAGDFTMQGEPLYVAKFNEWLGELPYKHKIVIPGNHELTFDEEFNPYYLEARAGITNATLLVNQSVIIDGVKFYGMPDTPEFFNWAFNRNQAEMPEYVDAIPEDTDVLITHGPPYGHLDPARRRVWDDLGNKKFVDESVGCRDLLKRVMEIKPKVHVFGHIHKGYGTKWFAGITMVNAAICNERYQPANLPVVVEI